MSSLESRITSVEHETNTNSKNISSLWNFLNDLKNEVTKDIGMIRGTVLHDYKKHTVEKIADLKIDRDKNLTLQLKLLEAQMHNEMTRAVDAAATKAANEAVNKLKPLLRNQTNSGSKLKDGLIEHGYKILMGLMLAWLAIVTGVDKAQAAGIVG